VHELVIIETPQNIDKVSNRSLSFKKSPN